MMADETHDAALICWLDAANDPASDFPIQNLPFGRFRNGRDDAWRIGVAIGDQVLDLARAGLADGSDINALMAQPRDAHRALRARLSNALRRGSDNESRLRAGLCAQSSVELGVPCAIGDYTDFYTSIHHATAVGRQFRPDNPLLPNYKWVPIGYHGRASSIVASGTPIRRPMGQTKPADAEAPRMGPSQRLDYELELGAFIARANALGDAVPIAAAEDHVFGLALFNDWTARDIQAWEYQPLGPFLSKNFASTVSPWMVTLDALAPFRAPFSRPAGDPQPLDYLSSSRNSESGAFDIRLEVLLQTARMRDSGTAAQPLMASNFRDSYWTLAQLVAHHTVNGCNLQSGDLLGTGTQSGPGEGQGGSMLELSVGGRQPLRLANGETRSFLEDGDTVTLRAHCERPGFRRIGFGECIGTILPTFTRASS
ncbi:MAG: fumarylacetoacetase [Betaproteobacteria bacterium]